MFRTLGVERAYSIEYEPSGQFRIVAIVPKVSIKVGKNRREEIADKIATQMTTFDISKAQQLAREWLEKR